MRSDVNESTSLFIQHFPDMSNGYPYCRTCRAQFDTVREWSEHLARVVDKNTISWPAKCYIYGTWSYALGQARARVTRHGQKMWLYQSTLDGQQVWVVSWDPKK